MNPITVTIIAEDVLLKRVNNKIQGSGCNVHGMGFQEAETGLLSGNPDMVFLSIRNLRSPGMTLLSILRHRFPKLPIIAIVPENKEAAKAAVTALRVGAIDFITMPNRELGASFIKTIEKRLKGVLKVEKSTTIGSINQSKEHKFLKPTLSPEVIVMGGGAGGVQALFTILAALPKGLNVPVIIAQHFPHPFTACLAEKLNAISDLTVRKARDGRSVKGGEVWLVPSGYSCEVKESNGLPKLKVVEQPAKCFPINMLFRSAALHYGNRSLGVLLSGFIDDGISGVLAIKDQGGEVIIQDPRTAMVPELPLTIIKKRLANSCYFPEGLADQMVKRSSLIPHPLVASNGYGNALKKEYFLFRRN